MAMLATLHVAAPAAQTMSGVGAHRCKAFSYAASKDSKVAIDAYVAWSQGFISAFNWANVRQQDVQIDAPGIIDYLAQYCSGNPETRIYTAVQELIRLNAR